MGLVRNMFRAVLASTALVVSIGSANAALLNGNTVSFQYLFPGISNNYSSPSNGNYLVGAGVEIPNGLCCSFEGQLDISDNNLRVDFHGSSNYTSSGFNGFRISDVFGQIASFTSVTIDGVTNMVGFDASRITFDADNIWVNWQGLAFNPGVVVSINVNGGGNVPEPGALALAGLALAGLAAARRRKVK